MCVRRCARNRRPGHPGAECPERGSRGCRVELSRPAAGRGFRGNRADHRARQHPGATGDATGGATGCQAVRGRRGMGTAPLPVGRGAAGSGRVIAASRSPPGERPRTQVRGPSSARTPSIWGAACPRLDRRTRPSRRHRSWGQSKAAEPGGMVSRVRESPRAGRAGAGPVMRSTARCPRGRGARSPARRRCPVSPWARAARDCRAWPGRCRGGVADAVSPGQYRPRSTLRPVASVVEGSRSTGCCGRSGGCCACGHGRHCIPCGPAGPAAPGAAREAARKALHSVWCCVAAPGAAECCAREGRNALTSAATASRGAALVLRGTADAPAGGCRSGRRGWSVRGWGCCARRSTVRRRWR